jgi:hypothetical protein
LNLTNLAFNLLKYLKKKAAAKKPAAKKKAAVDSDEEMREKVDLNGGSQDAIVNK